MTVEMAKLREFAAKYGYWPATSDDAHLAHLIAQDERTVRANPRQFAKVKPPEVE